MEQLMLSEKIFKGLLYASGIVLIILIVGAFITLLTGSWESIKEFGLSFLITSDWSEVKSKFGALPFIVGTLFTSFLALLIVLPFSLSISIFLGECYQKGKLASLLSNTIELLAGIPSVIYGFWAVFLLVPLVGSFQHAFGGPSHGFGILSSSIILAIMILPYSASIGREVISLTPNDIKEAAYSLGSTKFEVIKKIVLPYSLSGIFAGFILALGRALGETMAVTMLIGNSNKVPGSLFDPANTMASVIANEFNETSGNLQLSVLIEIGLILFVVTTIINLVGKMIIKRFAVPSSN